MEPRNLYVLRYRQNTTGVQVGYLTASSLAIAEALGHWWCDQRFTARYIEVEPAVIADEADLPNLAELKSEGAAKAEKAGMAGMASVQPSQASKSTESDLKKKAS